MLLLLRLFFYCSPSSPRAVLLFHRHMWPFACPPLPCVSHHDPPSISSPWGERDEYGEHPRRTLMATGRVTSSPASLFLVLPCHPTSTYRHTHTQASSRRLRWMWAAVVQEAVASLWRSMGPFHQGRRWLYLLCAPERALGLLYTGTLVSSDS